MTFRTPIDATIDELEALYSANLRERVVERAVELVVMSPSTPRPARFGELMIECGGATPSTALCVSLLALADVISEQSRQSVDEMLTFAFEKGDDITRDYAECVLEFPPAEEHEIAGAATDLLIGFVLRRPDPDEILKIWFGGISQYPVIPTDLERLKKVREIIRRKFSLTLSAANTVTAALFGFRDYRRLREEIFDSGSVDPDEREDEFCSVDIVAKRRECQAKVLAKHVDVDAHLASKIISLVRPTAKDWPPSLAGLNPFHKEN